MQQQLTLNFHLNTNYRFDNFYGESNHELVALLQSMANGRFEPCVYLWGTAGSGRTHLLQATGYQASETGLTSVYIPLLQRHLFSIELLDGVENLDLVCVDDVDAIIEDERWQEALFHLFNRLQTSGNRLIVSAKAAPMYVPFNLLDLRSRLAFGLIFQVKELSDEEKLIGLQKHAKQNGLTVSDEVGNFLLHRCSRDMNTLMQILKKLDQATLIEQRRLTIPFVKEVLKI